jgi:hypothetical protein
MQKIPLTLAVILTIVLSLIATGISVYQTGHIISARVPFKSIPPQEELVIDRTTVDALRHIVQARAYIHEKAPGKAGYEVAETVRLLRTIRDNLSPKLVRDRIWIARKHLEFEPASEILGDFPAIYAALDDIDIYLPTDKAKRHIDRAREHLEKKDKREADRELELADKSLVSVEVEIPLLSVGNYIFSAQEYLNTNNDEKADRALKIAEQKTQAVSLIVGSPLRAAQRSFRGAIKQYSAGKMAEARMYVEQAKASLEQVLKLGDTTAREEAGKLYKDVTDLERKINKGGKAGRTALMAALEKSQALIEREAEYLAAGWAKAEATKPLENMMIEAKLHVAYAETYQVTAGEPANAVKELDKAEHYLAKALKNESLGIAAQQNIRAMTKKLEDLKLHPEKSDSSIEESYDAIKAELGGMIQRMELGDMAQKMEGSE